jgi:hypothetical protein
MAALNGGRPLPASYLMPNMQLPPNTNVNLKLPNTRQTQWAMAAQLQRPASVVNGLDGQMNGALTNGMVAVSPTLSQSVPVRSPSANGQRAGLRNGVHVNGSSILSRHIFSRLRPFLIYHNPNHLHASLWLRVWVCLHRRCSSQLGATRMGTEQAIRVLWLFRTFLITCSRGTAFIHYNLTTQHPNSSFVRTC